ncbi:hypothetical protein A3752_10015, partial [Oleiphilus sp. HI0081]
SITNGIDDTDFITSWTDQTSAINSLNISDFSGFFSGNNTISHLSISLTSAISGSWGIEAGLDAGYGAALYVDGSLIENRTDDLWWQYNWNNSDVLSGTAGISAGSHTIDLYWAENCCNGYSSGRFTTDGGSTWQSLSVANIDAATVSEPATLALFGLGLLGLAGVRRFK